MSWRRRIQRLSLGARNALEIARFGRLTEPYRAPYEVLAKDAVSELRRYTSEGERTVGPLLLVPPLMVTSEVYDIAPDISAVGALERAGVDVWLCDFGVPEEAEGGMERTLDAHVVAVSDAIDFVYKETGRPVHLAGYSQGGMFCYQAAAFRRCEGLGSVITFGSPVDIRRNLPNVDEGAAEQLIRLAETILSRPLDRMEGLPGFMTSTGFKLVSVRKEVGQLVDFVRKLHDRQALEKRESRRRFLGGEGFVAWPGPALRKFIDEFIVHNRMLSGGFVIDGRTVTLADIRCPVLYFVGERDDIARPASVQAVQRAIPHGELYEVSVPAGHFGIVVGSKALAKTWPTVVQWMKWREDNGPRPELLRDEEATVPLEDPEVAGFEDIDVDVSLFIDAITDVGRSLWNRLGQMTDDAGDLVSSLRYQIPRLSQLEKIDGDTPLGIARALAEQTASEPDRTFFLWRGRAFTYAEADRRVDAVVRGLFHLEVKAGDRVGVWMGGRPSLLTAVTSLNRMGAAAALLRPHDDPQTLRQAMEMAGATAVIVDPERAAQAREIFEGPVWVLGGGASREVEIEGVVDMEQIDPTQVAPPVVYRPNPGRARDVAMLLFTDGGDGLRMARITNGRWAFSALGGAAACTLTSDDTVYAALPLHHAAGMLVTVGSALVGGARIALATDGDSGFPRTFDGDPAVFWDEVRRYGVTVVFYAGEMCRILLNAPFRPSDRTNAIRLFAGSGMKAVPWKQVMDRFDAGVLEFYASTEGSAVLANAAGTKVGAMGRPLPGSAEMAVVRYDFETRALVRDPDGLMSRAPVDEPGLLLARIDDTHPSHAEPDAARVVRNVFTNGDRWWASRDVLRMDREGDAWFLGALRDCRLIEGDLVTPRPIENALESAPGVVLALVRMRDDEPVATLAITDEAPDPADVVAALRTLHATSWPRTIAFVPVSDVPLTAGYRVLARRIEAEPRWRLVEDRYEAI